MYKYRTIFPYRSFYVPIWVQIWIVCSVNRNVIDRNRIVWFSVDFVRCPCLWVQHSEFRRSHEYYYRIRNQSRGIYESQSVSSPATALYRSGRSAQVLDLRHLSPACFTPWAYAEKPKDIQPYIDMILRTEGADCHS